MVKLMRRKKTILICLIGIFSLSFISATTLKTLVDSSIDKSEQITNLKLNKDYTMLTLEVSELDSKTIVSVSPSLYSADFDEYNFEGNGGSLVSIVIPGDYIPTREDGVSDTTSININSKITYDSSDKEFSLSNSSLNLSHNFLLGDYSNNQKDLNNQLTLLKANQAYETGILEYKKNVYNYVSNLIENEKAQKDIEKKLKDQQKIIDDGLKLKQISKDSISYKQYSLVLNSYNDTLENLQIQKESLLENFKEYTGIDYKEVDEIKEPVLELPSSFDNSLSVQIAQLNVRIKQDTIDQVEREETQSYLNLNSTISDYNLSDPLDNNSNMALATELTYGANNLSINAGTSIAIDFDGSQPISPSFQVGGRWKNDTTNESDVIENKLNENALISTQLALNSTKQSKALSKLTFNTQITNWRAQYKQLLDNIEYKRESLSLNKQMLELGLVSKTEVEDIEFEIEQLNYDKMILLIDGLTIELDIEKLNL